jgi:DNA ligase 3
VQEEAELRAAMHSAMRESLEGLVLKNVDSVYEPGKRHWLKVKRDYLEQVCVCLCLCVSV